MCTHNINNIRAKTARGGDNMLGFMTIHAHAYFDRIMRGFSAYLDKQEVFGTHTHHLPTALN